MFSEEKKKVSRMKFEDKKMAGSATHKQCKNVRCKSNATNVTVCTLKSDRLD